MTIDHIGYIFFPQYDIFRILGRIAFPIFAFMLSEGCRYTKNKLKYFLTVFIVGALCQIVYSLYSGDLYLNILITFSFSILLIYSLQFFKDSLLSKEYNSITKLISFFLLILLLLAVYIFYYFVPGDYGFFGCLLPVFPAIFHLPKECNKHFLRRLDSIKTSLLMLSVGLFFLVIDLGAYEAWSFLALPFIFLYSGTRGKHNMKYFFYLYYPAHLLFLEVINLFVR